jgi:hypothetical protein
MAIGYINIYREKKKKKDRKDRDCVIYRSGNNDFQLSAALGSLARSIHWSRPPLN